MTLKKKTVSSDGRPIVSKCMEFRIKPTMEQKVLIWKTIGCCRYTYNHLLDERIRWEKDHPGDRVRNTTPAHLKEDAPFLKEVDSMALVNTQLHVNQACAKLFPKGKMPRFRQKGKDRRSYTTNCMNGNITLIHIRDDENYIRLPKLGRVRLILHRDIPAGWRLKNVTVKETAGGKFFVSITFDVEDDAPQPKREIDRVEAFDYSMPSLAVSASGQFDVNAEDIRWYRSMEERIAREQRKLSHMEYGSANYWDQRHKIGRLHEKVKNRRKDFLHKLSHEVASTFDLVAVEDIDLAAMSRSLNFGKAVYDNGFGTFRVFLAYKLKAKGGMLVKVDRFFPSSQRCSDCGSINPEVKNLSVRNWTCPVCGAVHNRDRNSCYNILERGYETHSRWAEGDSSLKLSSDGVLKETRTLPHG